MLATLTYQEAPLLRSGRASHALPRGSAPDVSNPGAVAPAGAGAGKRQVTAARGRGKSAALGLAIASAVAHDYSNIFVTAPSPENLGTVFEFVLKGLEALHFKEHADYSVVQSTVDSFNKAIVRINLFKSHRQTVQYVQPQDAHMLAQAELVGSAQGPASSKHGAPGRSA